MGLCNPGARAVDMQSVFNVGSGFGFSGGAAAQGNSSVKDNYLLSNSVSKSVIVFTRLTSLSPSLRSHLSYPPSYLRVLVAQPLLQRDHMAAGHLPCSDAVKKPAGPTRHSP
jgi:hypothetical protein